MGIDAKDVQRFLWRILRFSMNTACRCVRKHPVVAAVLVFFFLMYLFLPSVFHLLFYSSPVLVCTAVVVGNYLSSRSHKIQNVKEKGKGESSVEYKSAAAEQTFNRHERSYLNPQRSVRRNARMKVDEIWDSQVSDDQKDKVILTTLYTDLLGRTPQFEDSPKAAIEEIGSSSLDPRDTSSGGVTAAENNPAAAGDHTVLNSEPLKHDLMSRDGSMDMSEKLTSGGGETEVESLEEDDDEEDMQEERNKAVAWTEDDQKNLMDLGLSEMERNRRLESLIARRRARKLFKIAVEKSLMDMDSIPPGHIAPILVSRNNPLEGSSNTNVDYLQMPGSAPSILLPGGRNPFDLPYDPQEEKPNLMGDSFHQEFAVAHQKDMLFCRHESFHWGLYSSEAMQDRQDPRIDSIHRQPDIQDHGHLIEQLLPEEGESLSHSESGHHFDDQGGQALKKVDNLTKIKHEGGTGSGNSINEEVVGNDSDMESRADNKSEVQTETDSIRNNDSESSSPCSSRESEESFSTVSRTKASENLDRRIGKYPLGLANLPISLINSTARGISGYEPTYDSQRIDEHLFYRGQRSCHTPSYSIASDLQVEVSEVGSPPPAVDGNFPSTDGESFFYDGNVLKEITSGSEEAWGSSGHLPAIEETESRSREVNKITREGYLEIEFSGIDKKPIDPIASSSTLPVEVAQQDLTDACSSSSSQTDITERLEDQFHFVHMDHKAQEGVKPIGEAIMDYRPPNTLHTSSPENSERGVQMMAELVLPKVYSGKPEELSGPPEKYTDKMKITSDSDRPVIHVKGDMDLRIEDGGGSSQTLIGQEASHCLTKTADENKSESSKHGECSYEKPAEKEMKEEINLNNIEEIEGDPEKQTEDKEIGDVMRPTQGTTNMESVECSKNEENIDESVVLGISQSFNDSISSTLQTQQSIGQVSANSSSSSSPRSVLLDRTPKDHTSSSNFEEQEQIATQQAGVEYTVRDNALDEQLPGSSMLNEMQIAQNVVGNVVTCPSDNSSFEKLEEPCGPAEVSLEEAATTEKEDGHEPSRSKEDSDSNVSVKPVADSPGKLAEEANLSGSTNVQVNIEKKDEGTLKSVNGNEGESQFSTRQEITARPLQPAEVLTSRSAEDMVGNSSELKDEFVIDLSKMNEENVSSTATKDNNQLQKPLEQEEILYPPKMADAEGNSEANRIVPGDSGILEEQGVAIDPSKVALATDRLDNPTTSLEGKELLDSLRHNSTAEVFTISNMNGSVSDEMSNKAYLKHLGDGEHQAQSRQEAIVEPSKVTTASASISVKDTEFKPENFAEDEAKISPSNLEGENSCANNLKLTEAYGKLTDSAGDLPVQGDTKGEVEGLTDDSSNGDKFANHNIGKEQI